MAALHVGVRAGLTLGGASAPSSKPLVPNLLLGFLGLQALIEELHRRIEGCQCPEKTFDSPAESMA